MSLEENIIEIQPMKINVNDIFEKKIEIGPLLEFKLLQKIIEEFIERQNKTNNKINELEQKIITIENMPNISNINYQSNDMLLLNNILNEAFEGNDLIVEKNEDNKKGKGNREIKEEDNKNQDNVEKEDVNKKNLSNLKKNKNKKILLLFQQMIGKINNLENKYREIVNQINIIKNDSKKEFKSLKDKSEESLPKISGLENQKKEINNKIEEEDSDYINIISDEDGDLDINKKKIKVWIKNSEEKLTKKIEISNNRNKNLEISLNETINEIKDFKNKLNSYELKSQNIIEKDDIHEETKNMLENLVSKEELDKTKSNIKKLIDEIGKNISKNWLLNLNEEKFNELLISKLNQSNKDLKDNILKIIENNDKYVNNQIEKLGIDAIKNEISLMKKELDNKLNIENIGSINLKLEEMENYEETLRKFIDDHANEIRLFKDKFANFFTILDDLRGQVFSLFEKQKSIIKKEKESVTKIDLEPLISKQEYNEDREKINKKIDKALAQETVNYQVIQELQTKLKGFVVETDLKNLEKNLTNILNENKYNISKKYVEKTDLQKNLRLLELKIKTLEETGSKENENCFLAKKPINGFLCASCETYIGDLKNNEDVSTWNKLENKKNNKNYRFGHGFSTMIKMLNSNLLKKLENKSNDTSDLMLMNNSQELRPKYLSLRKIKKNLPKIFLSNNMNIKGAKSMNISFNMNKSQNNEVNERLHNNSINSINLNNNSLSQLEENDLKIKSKSIDKTINENNINYFNKDIIEVEQPKVIKITKKIKQV